MTAPLPPAYVLLDDQDGRRHAIRRQAILGLVEDPPATTTLLLAGGRVIVVDQDLGTTLAMIA